ncbi:MAG: hypothetical protein BGO24_01535 [Sphingomonas sp. 67-36]|nr:MAG: hypothetical protein BGO24_01535 [Sphingomonas sp. 67-36]
MLSDTGDFLATADQPFWRALAQGRLTMQHCTCGQWHWPAVWRCGECGRYDPAWEEIAFAGTVFSWQTSTHRFGGTEGIAVPYTSVLVEVAGTGGRRLLGLLEGGDGSDMAIGQPVTGRMEPVEVRGEMVPGIRWQVAA